uniref:Evasin n=1 Tax=Amblyomma cajennense TaxID=34607 RepID=A0A023FT24_AMBCJ
MWFVWIFATTVVLVASENEDLPAAPGCGDTSVTTKAPSPPVNKKYGFYKYKGCVHYVLKSHQEFFTATCYYTCDGHNYTYPRGETCLKLKQASSSDGQRNNQTRCYTGVCFGRRCMVNAETHPCKVPRNHTKPWRE